MTAGVYAIINTVTGVACVGSSIDIETRWISHRMSGSWPMVEAFVPADPRYTRPYIRAARPSGGGDWYCWATERGGGWMSIAGPPSFELRIADPRTYHTITLDDGSTGIACDRCSFIQAGAPDDWPDHALWCEGDARTRPQRPRQQGAPE